MLGYYTRHGEQELILAVQTYHMTYHFQFNRFDETYEMKIPDYNCRSSKKKLKFPSQAELIQKIQ